MARFALILMFVTLAVTIQGLPTTYDDIVAAAKTGNWDHVQQLINGNFGSEPGWKPLTFGNVRNLKPFEGGHVYGEAEYTFQSSSNINGQTTEESGGHKVVNNDGKVNEFDFKPTLQNSNGFDFKSTLQNSNGFDFKPKL